MLSTEGTYTVCLHCGQTLETTEMVKLCLACNQKAFQSEQITRELPLLISLTATEEGLVRAIVHYQLQTKRCREVLKEAQRWVKCDKDCKAGRVKYGCGCGAEKFNAAINVVLKETE